MSKLRECKAKTVEVQENINMLIFVAVNDHFTREKNIRKYNNANKTNDNYKHK
jgi:hypothetical protein